MHKESGQLLAIKQVPVDSDLQDIIKEISIMQQCDRLVRLTFVLTWQIFMHTHTFTPHLVYYIHSQYVVKYYGSYFKNTDLWIVMEYCGAGSVSDIMRIINRPVSYLLCEYLKIIQLHFVTHSMYICSTAQRGGDCNSVTVCSEGAGVSSL